MGGRQRTSLFLDIEEKKKTEQSKESGKAKKGKRKGKRK